MHELSITQSIVEIVAGHAKGRKVGRVTLEIGKCAGVMTDAVKFCFDVAAQGTALEGASLEIREIEAHARCAACGNRFVQETLYMPCPTCRSLEFERVTGDELLVKEYELA